MAKKQLTLDQIQEQSTGLTTKEQKALKEFMEKTLADKATKAANELDLITGGTKASGQ